MLTHSNPKHSFTASREELRASQHLTARDTAAEDAAIQAQRRRIEEREDADRAAVTEARRQLEKDVRASQQAFMQHHAQQRYVHKTYRLFYVNIQKIM